MLSIAIRWRSCSGRVISVTDYGAFVELEQGSKVCSRQRNDVSKRMKHPSKLVNVGSSECVVLSVNPGERRIRRNAATAANPWDALHDSIPWHDGRSRVRNLTDFGAFIEIEDASTG